MKLEEIDRQIQDLRKQILELREKRRQARLERERRHTKEQVGYWLNKVLIPFLEGCADRFDLSLEDAVKKLIKDREDFGSLLRKHSSEAHMSLNPFFDHPAGRVLLAMTRPFLGWSAKQTKEAAKWILNDVLSEVRPSLYETIIKHEGGEDWWIRGIIGLKSWLKEKA